MNRFVFDTKNVDACVLWCEVDSIMEVILVHDFTKLCRTIRICDRGFHVEGVGAFGRRKQEN